MTEGGTTAAHRAVSGHLCSPRGDQLLKLGKCLADIIRGSERDDRTVVSRPAQPAFELVDADGRQLGIRSRAGVQDDLNDARSAHAERGEVVLHGEVRRLPLDVLRRFWHCSKDCPPDRPGSIAHRMGLMLVEPCVDEALVIGHVSIVVRQRIRIRLRALAQVGSACGRALGADRAPGARADSVALQVRTANTTRLSS